MAGVGKYSEIFLSPEHGRRTPSRHPDGNATTDKSDKYDENFLSANEFQSTEYGPADTLPSPRRQRSNRLVAKTKMCEKFQSPEYAEKKLMSNIRNSGINT